MRYFSAKPLADLFSLLFPVSLAAAKPLAGKNNPLYNEPQMNNPRKKRQLSLLSCFNFAFKKKTLNNSFFKEKSLPTLKNRQCYQKQRLGEGIHNTDTLVSVWLRHCGFSLAEHAGWKRLRHCIVPPHVGGLVKRVTPRPFDSIA